MKVNIFSGNMKQHARLHLKSSSLQELEFLLEDGHTPRVNALGNLIYDNSDRKTIVIMG